MATDEQKEGLKFLDGWCKWFAAIDTAAIGGLGFLFRPDKPVNVPTFVRCSGVVAAACFGMSIIFAGAMLISLPQAVQDIGPTDKVFDRRAYLGAVGSIVFWKVAYWQFGLFLLGIITFAITVAGMAWVVPSP